jgi:hypothetical protein
MKNYKKIKTIQVRISESMELNLKKVGDHLKLDKADLVRMLISNGLRYWLEQLIGDQVKQQVDKRADNLKSILDIAATKWVE